MRAGKLDKTITIDRLGTSVDAYGTTTEGWTLVATARAQLVQGSTAEFLASYGSKTETVAVFRIRHLDGLHPDDRITHGGVVYDLKEVKELGRRQGLELRCVASGQAGGG